MQSWKDQASHMVKTQLKTRGIRDKQILEVMQSIPRHEYVMPAFSDQAYGDYPLPINCHQTISQPYIVAYMTQSLDCEQTHHVLEIGTGSGYQTSVLAEIASHVTAVEIYTDLLHTSEVLLTRLGYHNVTYRHGSGYHHIKNEEFFDRIIVTAAPSELPQVLLDQLVIGGIMVVPVGVEQQKLLHIRKCSETEFIQTELCEVRFVPMIHEL